MKNLELDAFRLTCNWSLMEKLYGFKKRFASRAAAENFLRHVMRELTAGGLPHWIEAREDAPGAWSAWVHRSSCEGGGDCRCDDEETSRY